MNVSGNFAAGKVWKSSFSGAELEWSLRARSLFAAHSPWVAVALAEISLACEDRWNAVKRRANLCLFVDGVTLKRCYALCFA